MPERRIRATGAHARYFLPHPTPWPVMISAGLFVLAIGFVLTINALGAGPWLMSIGALVVVTLIFRWFRRVIIESESGAYSYRVDRTFRWGMSWFIFSEVAFFAALFGVLFYLRHFALPGLAANDSLWPGFQAIWPTAGPRGPVAIEPDIMPGPNQFSPMGAWGIPAVNTLILMSSAVTMTWAHWGLLRNDRARLITGLFVTLALGVSFLALQSFDYVRAYKELGLTLSTGVYGATFFVLTGFHGLHVALGAIMLLVILGRALKGHFRPDNHFAFEAVSWYWHFVDVVWLFLFVFVYWL